MLLQRSPICCMKEKYGDAQKHPTTQNRLQPIVLALKDAVIRIAKLSLATYALRKFALSQPFGSLQTPCLYGSHYLWFIFHHTLVSFYSTTSLQSRYMDPLTYADTLTSMSLPHRLYGFFIRHILFAPPFPLHSPSYLQDLAVAIPLRFSIDVAITAGRNLLSKAGLTKSERPRWTGSFPSFPNPEKWKSPAERVFESVLGSELVAESMVLKLLREDTLASQPYERSEAARKLLGLAVDKCWPELTRFLVGAGVPIDQGVSPASEELKWPALSESFTYVFPSDSLKHLPVSYFHGRPVLSYADKFDLKSPEPNSSFAQLVRSSRFRDLATSESELDWAHCQRMMNILRDSGANPLSTDRHGHDALSYLAPMSCSTDVLRHMADLWKEARARSASTEGSLIAASKTLYQAINTLVPNLETLRILLDSGVSPEWENEGRTPLFTAAYMNNTTDAMRLLIKFGANPNNGGKKGYPPILRTLDDTSYEKFVFFLDHGADPNGTKDDGRSILQIVLELSPSLLVLKAGLVQCLVERGSVVYNATTQSSHPFLTAASQHDSVGWSERILDLLLEQIPTDQRQKQLDAALLVASCGSLKLRKSGNRINIFTTFYLLRKGADPVSVKHGFDSLLHLIRAVRGIEDHQYRGEMRTLLERGVLDVNARGERGKSPLHHAVKCCSRDFVLLLLEHGADPNMLDANGLTPLQHLCATNPEVNISHDYMGVESDAYGARYRGVRGQAAWGFESRKRRRDIKCSLEQEEIFQALVDHHADIEIVNGQGQTLLMMACKQGNSVLAANILYRFGKERFAEVINMADFTGKTAFHLAAANGDVNALKVLLDPHQILRPELNLWRKLAVESQNRLAEEESQSSELATEKAMAQQELLYAKSVINAPSFLRQNAIYFDKPDEVTVTLTIGDTRRSQDQNICLPNVSVSSWTIDTREDIILRPEKLMDVRFRTPLHYAAKSGRLDAVKLLLTHTGINVDAEDTDAKKAMDLALENNFYDVYSVLTGLEEDPVNDDV